MKKNENAMVIMRIFWFFVRLYDNPAIINNESAKIIMQAIKTS
jgi:hypothetical protein